MNAAERLAYTITRLYWHGFQYESARIFTGHIPLALGGVTWQRTKKPVPKPLLLQARCLKAEAQAKTRKPQRDLR
ncbi:hypothetical protein XFF6992_510164 [Xanthomonas citri pv. fuscans]|nr:hypothetical protein XFF6992_510164 [Xanthomonas citri pv. fuscans]SOO35268.1 hypothetical protein XFF6994_5180007 [Xanthomonas citri pv. fuscans]